MRKITFAGSTVALALALFAPATAAQDSGEERIVPLEKILQHPVAFRGITVSFIAQFHRLEAFDNTVHTKFERYWDLNFSVWPDGAPIWHPSGYRNDHPYLFLRRSSDGAKVILQAPLLSRWIITGEVQRVFKGKPWIEVKGLKRLPNQLDQRSLSGLAQGFRAAEEGRWEDAVRGFHQAHGEDQPYYVRVMAVRQEAAAYQRLGMAAKALDTLNDGLEFAPEDAGILADMEAIEATLPRDEEGRPVPPPSDPEGMGMETGPEQPVQPGMDPAHPRPRQPEPGVGREPMQPGPERAVAPPADEPGLEPTVREPAQPTERPGAEPPAHEPVPPVDEPGVEPTVREPAPPAATRPTETRPGIGKVTLEVSTPTTRKGKKEDK